MKIITLKKTKKEKRNLFYLRNIFKVSYIYNFKNMFKFQKKTFVTSGVGIHVDDV